MVINMNETQTNEQEDNEHKPKIEFISRVCHCGYCKFCGGSSNGTSYIQVYVNKKPIVAGKTYQDAIKEYEHYRSIAIKELIEKAKKVLT